MDTVTCKSVIPRDKIKCLHMYLKNCGCRENIGAMRTFSLTWRLERPFWQEENVVCTCIYLHVYDLVFTACGVVSILSLIHLQNSYDVLL